MAAGLAMCHTVCVRGGGGVGVAWRGKGEEAASREALECCLG